MFKFKQHFKKRKNTMVKCKLKGFKTVHYSFISLLTKDNNYNNEKQTYI